MTVEIRRNAPLVPKPDALPQPLTWKRAQKAFTGFVAVFRKVIAAPAAAWAVTF